MQRSVRGIGARGNYYVSYTHASVEARRQGLWDARQHPTNLKIPAMLRRMRGIDALGNSQAVTYTLLSRPEGRANGTPGGIPRIPRPSAMPHTMRGIGARVGARLFLGTK